MAFIITGIYVAALFGVGMWFVHNHKAVGEKPADADHSYRDGYESERRHNDRRRGVPA